MAGIDGLLQELPIADIAAKLGVDEATATQAVSQALPALIGGLQANAQDPAGAASLEEAVQQHDSSLFDGGINLDDVDEADGEKIVGHVFGDNKEQVVQALGNTGGGSTLIQQILPILAPIVLAFLAKQFGPKPAAAEPAAAEPAAEGGLGGLLGGLLGGGGAGAASGGQAGGIGDILGGLLGGGAGGGQGGGLGGALGDILGGLLGGGRK